jgi:multicomponent Na+:H+ antiporter subunit A
VGFVLVDAANSIVGPAAVEINSKATAYQLIQWPGLKTAFVVSIGILAVGAIVGVAAARRIMPTPAAVGADTADSLIDGVLDTAPRLISRIQHGSLPVYIATMGVVASLAVTPFLADLSFDHVDWWHNPAQPVLAAATVGIAFAGAFVSSRLGAALTLGAVGISVSGLFFVQGAPDLVLTQLLVETVIVVGFVLGLGHLARRFPKASDSWRIVRIGVSLTGGLAVVVGLIAAGGAPAGRPPIEQLITGAVDEGGGKNVVNVILTDIRALDTWGEIIVLVAVAVGVMSLAQAGRRDRQRQQLAAPELPGDGATGRVEVPA